MKSGKRYQNLKDEWIRRFPWLKGSQRGPGWISCKACNKDLNWSNDGITALKRHANTKKHKACIEAVKIQSTDRSDLLQLSENISSVQMRARRVEILVSLFIARHNLPIALSDDLITFLKHVDLDRKVQKELSCGATKCTAIICNVTGKYTFSKLVSTLRKQKFSLIVDESTDVASTKNLALSVRFRSKNYTVVDQFLALLQVHDASSAGLYKAIQGFFLNHGIPYLQNMIGFAADGASVMFGERDSLVTKLKKDIPHLFVIKCVCHSLALAVSYATKVLPSNLSTLLTDVYRYLKYSSKRQDSLGKFQVLLDLPEHKILRFHKLRWLSLHSVVLRFLEQYDALYLYFQEESMSKNKKTASEAERIFKILQSHFTKLYLHFLSHILPLVCKRNEEFQAERPKIYTLYNKMLTLFKTVTAFYLDDDYVDRNEPEFIPYCERLKTEDNARYWEPLKNVDLGPVVTAELVCLSSKIPARDIEEFRRSCRTFYITLAEQLILRFPFQKMEVKMIEKLSFLDDVKKFKTISDIACVLGMDHEDIDREYKLLRRSSYVTDSIDECEDDFTRIIKFWKKVGQDSDFIHLNDLVERVFLLPHSSATVERIFSSINLNKTKVRNRLSPSTVTGLLHSKTCT